MMSRFGFETEALLLPDIFCLKWLKNLQNFYLSSMSPMPHLPFTHTHPHRLQFPTNLLFTTRRHVVLIANIYLLREYASQLNWIRWLYAPLSQHLGLITYFLHRMEGLAREETVKSVLSSPCWLSWPIFLSLTHPYPEDWIVCFSWHPRSTCYTHAWALSKQESHIATLRSRKDATAASYKANVNMVNLRVSASLQQMRKGNLQVFQ